MRTIAKPIQMVNWVDEQGVVTPVRFRIKNEEGATTVVKIMRIHRMDKQRIAGNVTFVYQCEVVLNDQLMLCEIRYNVEKCQWILFKM